MYVTQIMGCIYTHGEKKLQIRAYRDVYTYM